MNFGAEQFFDGFGKRWANIPTIGQDALNGVQISSATAEGKQSTFAVSHLGRLDGNDLWAALCILGAVYFVFRG